MIVGHKIPAGTGLRKYDDLLVGSNQAYDELIDSKLESEEEEININ